jgi:hypothetical protein
VRQIVQEDEITCLQVFDFNYDGFKDILISTGQLIKIYFGDATSAYSKVISITTLYKPDKFVYGDYNRDGYFDINYINKQDGVIATIFAKSFVSFYPELIHKKENGIVDVISFYSKFVYGAAYLNVNGKVNIISKINSLSENQQLALAIKPNLLTSFDYLNNGIIDFAFTNDDNQTLNFILRDAAGLPENLFSINLFEQHKNLKVSNNSKYINCFYFFSNDARSIEFLEVDFSKYTFNRKFYYAEGLIEDVVISYDNKNDPEIFILYSKKGKLGLQVQTKVEEEYYSRLYTGLEKNWYDAYILSEKNRSIGYLQRNINNLMLKTVTAGDKNYKSKLNVNTKTDSYSTISNVYFYSNKNAKDYFGIFKDENHFFLFIDENIYLQSNNNKEFDFRITSKNQLFFGKNNTVFISDNNQKSLFKLKLSDKTKQFNFNQIFSDVEINNYLVEKLEPRTSNLIFTSIQNGIIEIRQLP